jgi:hypothetical protein
MLVSDERVLYADIESLSSDSIDELLGFEAGRSSLEGRTAVLRTTRLIDRWNWPKDTGCVWLSGDTTEFLVMGFVLEEGGEMSCIARFW